MPDPIQFSVRIFTNGGGTEINLDATNFVDATFADRVYGGFAAVTVTAGRGDGQVTLQAFDGNGGFVDARALTLSPDESTQTQLVNYNALGRRIAAVAVNISEPNTPPQSESVVFWQADPKDGTGGSGSGSGGTGTGGTNVQHGGMVVAAGVVTGGALRGFQSGIHQGFTRDGNRSTMTAIPTTSTGGAQ